MTIDISLDKSLVQSLHQITNELTIASDDRTRLGVGCLQISATHHQSIVLLIEHNCHASAFALLRPLFESFIRGVWIIRKASEEELQRYKSDCSFGLDNLFKAVITLDKYDESSFKNINPSMINTMHSLTHAGFSANVRHQTESGIESNYTCEELRNLLDFSNVIAKIASCEILDAARDIGHHRIVALEKAIGETSSS